jgi:5-methylcytosine-specific restriction enzyme B
VTLVQTEEAQRVYGAAARWKDAALIRRDSLFTPGRVIWERGPIADLYERFVNHPDASSDPFEQKFKRQLRGADDFTTQLAAELMYFYLLIDVSQKGSTKRATVNQVLSWMTDPVSIPSDLDDALDGGIVAPGVAFNTMRPAQLRFLLEFITDWQSLTPDVREQALVDPWRFREIVFATEVGPGYTMREALLHLVHPDTFEPIVSRDMKKRIAERLKQHVSDPTADVDHQLAEVRAGLAARFGPQFRWWSPEVRALWDSDSSPWGAFVQWGARMYHWEGFDADERDYKLQIASNLNLARDAVLADAADWPDLLARAFGSPNNLTYYLTHSRFVSWCRSNRAEGLAALRAIWAEDGGWSERLQGFLTRVPKEAMPSSRLSIASFLLLAIDPLNNPVYRQTPFLKGFELTGYPPPPRPSTDVEVYQHALGFLDKLVQESLARGLELRDRLDAQSVLWSVAQRPTDIEPVATWPREDQAAFLRYRGANPVDEDEDERESPEEQRLRALGDELLIDRSFLEKVSRLLKSKRQVILYGPPGTGKTYVAQKLARALVGGDGTVELVQFHPSYAYEDFVEGYRPSLIGNQPGFTLVQGPLRRLAEAARADPTEPHVLIIDEINRANIAKVFGELYFLLEYRDQRMRLQYSSEEPFTLPENLWIIGTMNTADRSIALVDAALRRRFYFVPFFPNEPPIQGLLGRWLARHHPDLAWVADIVDHANELLGDRHTAIGPSYFLRSDLSEEWVESIWEHAVLPYLEEQFFGREDELRKFKLSVLRSGGTAPTPPPEDAC